MKAWLPIAHSKVSGQRNMADQARFPSALLTRLVVAPAIPFPGPAAGRCPAHSDLTRAADLRMIRSLRYPSAQP